MKIQIDDVVRDATPAEIEVIEARFSEAAEQQQAALQARKSAFDKLAALGLTDSEINALLGA